MCEAELFPAGRGEDKVEKSAQIVTGGFVLQCGVLIKENITFSDF